MGFQPRIPTTFESLNGGSILTFGIAEFQWTSSQELIVPNTAVLGADYPHDYLGARSPIKSFGIEDMSFLFLETDPAAVDTDVDNLLSMCVQIGLGKLWLTDKNGVKRWAYARLANQMPVVKWQAGDIFTKAITGLRFRRQSDWLAATPTTGTIVLSSTPQTFTLTNAGNATVKGAAGLKFTFRSNSSSGFTHPQLENLTQSEQINSSRDATSVNSALEMDCERESVRYSTDDGATYANDYANVTLPAAQVSLMTLAPGVNNMKYTNSGGAPNCNLDYTFYPAYH